jgi:S-DNA-T family DNA segregation ATPase FtsK/SpoIIIE
VTVAPKIFEENEENPDDDETDIIRLDPAPPVIEKKLKRKRGKASPDQEETDPELAEFHEARKRLEERKRKPSMTDATEAVSDSFPDDDDDDDEEFSFSIQRPEPSILKDETLQEEDFEDLYTEEAERMQHRSIAPAESTEQDPEAAMVEGEQGSQSTTTPRQPQKNPRSSKEEMESGIRNIENEIQQIESIPAPKYHYPPLKLLKRGNGKSQGDSDEHLAKTAKKLQDTLRNFGVNVTVTNVSCGPTVTQYELQPEMGVKVSRIVSLADDIKLNLAAADIRIEAPIPGKAAVGIEVPNKENSPVMLRDLLSSQEFQGASSKLAFAVGKDIAGKPVVTDISKMPHLLIAGSTGSGKSVCINTLIASILYKATPDEVKLIMIDPKVVELSVYNGIPHLLIPVVTDPKKAAGALNWAVQEMTQRYNTFAEFSVRKLEEYNHKVENMVIPEGQERPKKMPQIVVIVDELADLMMVAPGEVEDAIVRLTQLARAAGIHLVIATQRPSVNVITGLIKANMPSRIAFAVSSGTDSRVILDTNGAEKLLGKGDMLFYPQGYPKPARLQGAFISDEEVSALVEFLADKNPKAQYNTAIEEQVNTAISIGGAGASGSGDRDVYFEEAGKFIIEKEKASIGMLQRMFKIGFNRAARIMDQLSDAGVVGPEEGTKPRKVLMSQSEFETYLEEH